MWEFQFERQGEEDFTGAISELEFIGVFIELEDLENLGNDIKVTICFGGGLQLCDIAITNVGLSEDAVGPLEQSLEDSFVLFLLSGFVAGESVWSVT